MQKRIRAVTQRRARRERLDPNQSVRPRKLDVADFQQQDKTESDADVQDHQPHSQQAAERGLRC